MMKLKRCLSFFLAVLILFSSVPIDVAAEEITVLEEIGNYEQKNLEVMDIEEAVENEKVTEITQETEEKITEIECVSEKLEEMENIESDYLVQVASNSNAIETVKYDSYEQFLAYYYLTYSSLDFYLNNDNLPYHTYVNNTVEDFEERLATWKIATMSASDLTTYSEKEVDFYVLLLYDVIYQKEHQKSMISEAKTAADALMASTLAELAETAAEGAIKLTPELNIMEDNWEEILNQLCVANTLKDVSKYSGEILKVVNFVGTVDELFEKLYMINEVIAYSEQLKIILNDIRNNTSDDLMKEACEKLLSMTTGLLSEAEIRSIFGGDIVIGEISGYALDWLWVAILKENAVFKAASIGQAIGKLASNLLCSTDAIVENWYSMEKVYSFEKNLKQRVLTYKSQFENDPTIENAKLFNKSVDMYLNTLSVGTEYSISYIENVKGGGVLGWIYKNLTNKDDYESMLRSLKNIKNNIDLSIQFANNETYNFYLEDMEENSNVEFSWEEVPCDVTQEEIDSGLEEVPEINFALSDQSVSVDTTFTAEKLTYADYYVNNGTLNLNGQTLTVYGDFYFSGGTIDLAGGVLDVRGSVYQSGGIMLISKGTLNIGGDYRIQSTAQNSAGETYYTYSSGILQMKYAEDKIFIGNDFIMHSNKGTGASGNLLDAGVMTVAGDFTQLKGTNSSYNNIKAVPSHKLILNGTGTQRVSFEQSTCFLGKLEIADTAEVTFSGYLSIAELVGDAEVKSDGLTLNNVGVDGHTQQVNTIGLNGYTLKIIGDVTTIGTINLGKGKLLIEGNLLQPSGKLVVNKGTLETTGDYRIQKSAIDSAGDKYYTYSSAVLQMKYAEDRIYVGKSFIMHSNEGTGASGNLLDAGVMTVAGDFTQLKGTNSSYNNIKAVPSHKLILNGTGTQRVSFEQSTCFLGKLEIADTAEVTFSGYLSIAELVGDAEVKSDGLTLNNVGVDGHTQQMNTIGLNSNTLKIIGDVTTIGTINLGKGKLLIEGNLLQPSGKIVINKGTLETTGDYRIQKSAIDSAGDPYYTASSGILWMQYDTDNVIIDGDFYTSSTYSHSSYLTDGSLFVRGDFFEKKGSAYNFSASGSHEVILCGIEPQTVTFESDSSRFNILKLSQDISQYTFNPNSCWNTLEENYSLPIEFDKSYISYGECGEGLEWTLNKEGVLSICGIGTMKNYTYKAEVPWYNYRDYVKNAVLEEGITRISDYAFYGMPKLTSITIPESVVSIGAYAFKGSTALDGVVLPSGLTQLGESAFYGCTALTAIDIPASLYTVRPYTFKNCTSLAKVTFHEGSLQKLSDAAFYGTALKEVVIPDCATIVDVYCFKNCSQLASVKISSNVKQIREAVFYGTALTEIDVPEGVTKIGPYAFKNCTNLTSINLPTTLTSVDEASFYACTALEEVLLPDAVTTIGNYAFRKCEKLASVTFSDELQTIGESSFYGCIGLTSLNIPENVTTIKGYAFKGCTGVTTVSLPDSLTTLGESAFYGCTGLGTIVIPVNVTTVGDYAFSRCSGLYEVQFTGNAPTIGSGAFSKVTATAYYPTDNATWTADIMQNYGGTLSWEAN